MKLGCLRYFRLISTDRKIHGVKLQHTGAFYSKGFKNHNPQRLTLKRELRTIHATHKVNEPPAQSNPTTSLAARETVPDVMVTFGNPPNHMTFASHPGVMAVVRLLEMKYIVSPRAVLTQENVDAIREFDPILADKCQVAVDAGIAINFMDIEHIDKPEFLQKFLREKKLLEQARREVLNAPPGEYRIPYCAKAWEKPEVPRRERPETAITPDILAVEPDLIKDIELQKIVTEYLQNKPIDEIWEADMQDPVFAAAEAEKTEARNNKTSTTPPIRPISSDPATSSNTASATHNTKRRPNKQ